MDETTDHLLTKCNYMEAVWNLVALRVGLQNYGWSTCLGMGKNREEEATCNALYILVVHLERIQQDNFLRQKKISSGTSLDQDLVKASQQLAPEQVNHTMQWNSHHQ
jgi:hypothetical protein